MATPEGELTESTVATRAERRKKRPLWASVLRTVVAALFIGGVGYAVASQWHMVRPVLGQLSLSALLAAGFSVFVGIYATFLAWLAIMGDLGFPLSHRAAMRVFFVSQLGKYVPGKLWPILVQMRLGRAYQIPVRASGAAALVFLLMVVGSGLAVAVSLLPVLGGRAWGSYWWTSLFLVLAVVAAMPPVLNRLIRIGLRLTRRQPLPKPLSARGVAVSASWSVLAWFGYGGHVWILARDLGAGDSVWLYLACTGGFAAAFCVGLLVPVAPAGTGAREAALILLLGGVLTRPQVIVIAVISRLMFTVLDVAWAGIAAFAARPSRQSSPDPAAERL